MPLKGENPITSYFPRVSPDAKLKAPMQPKPKLPKRARPPDEIDSATKGTSRKKSKGPKHSVARECAALRAPSSSSRAAFRQTAPAKKVIEIQDTPPNSPYKAAPSCQSTPSSSPLPDLTPSPEAPRNISRFSSFGGVVADAEPTPSCGVYLKSREAGPDFIPSSQTQAIDYLSYEDEGLRMFQRIALPSSSIPIRSPQIPSYIPSSQPDTTGLELFTTQDDFVPSSQSQFMDPIPISPVIPIPSSQSQELFYSQHDHNSPKKGSDTSDHRRTSLMDIITDESEARAQSLENDEHVTLGTSPGSTIVDVKRPCLPASIPSSQTPTCTSRPSSPNHEGEKVPPQSVQDCWNDREGSYESLPDAVKDFRGMFGETFESLPPDFPMSLRF